jgi:hypothetical protein
MSENLDIVAETVNRIRVSDAELMLLWRVLQKVNVEELSIEEKKFYNILTQRVNGRLKIIRSQIQ